MAQSSQLNHFEANDALLKYVYSGVIGDTKGLAVAYSLMRTTDQTFTYSAALEKLEGPPCLLDRYQINVDRSTGQTTKPILIEITDEEMQRIMLAATGEDLASSSRFLDGGLSISYKVVTLQKPGNPYVVQLRHHGRVASMDAMMKFVRSKDTSGTLPVPTVYSIPGEAKHQETTGFGRQIADLVPGVIAETVYSSMPHDQRLRLVHNIALAWQVCWDLPSPSPQLLGELVATEENGEIKLSIGPDRHFSLGGPFHSVRDWLIARIRHALTSLERASGIDEYKSKYLEQIQTFVNHGLDSIPESVNSCPVTALHVDMGLHNIIVSADDHTKINGVIDWEFCAKRSVPCL